MTCQFCENPEVSFTYKTVSLCADHRTVLLKALLYDWWKAGLVAQTIEEFIAKGPRALDDVR